MDKKTKNLELIQGIILRMANNSFTLKGWTVTLVSAMFALSGKDADKKFVILTYFPVIMFWILDSYFLSQEKYFIKVYEEVRIKDEKDIDFDLKSKSIKWDVDLWVKAAASLTIGIFYGTIIIILLIIMNLI